MLVREPKWLPPNWRRRIRLRPKRGHDEQHLEVNGDAGNRFRLILSQSRIDPLNFSIILATPIRHSNQLFRLRRCNGNSRVHTNRIEDISFRRFHIHMATERYQEAGLQEDAYADPTDRYDDFNGALRCMFDDANIKAPPEVQGDLFEKG